MPDITYYQKYHWQESQYPLIAGDEVQAAHFEDLRKMIWLLHNLAAGRTYTDYESFTGAVSDDGRSGSQSWTAYTNTFADGAFPMAEADIATIRYFGPSETVSDIYTLRKAVESRSELLAHPPVKSSGDFDDIYWARSPDSNYYHDFDRNANRNLVVRTKDGSPPTLRAHVLDVASWRCLPVQVDAAHQQNRIKYTDTDRTIPHRLAVEYKWSYVTQTPTLGAQYDLEVYEINANQKGVAKFAEEKNIGAGGLQYAHNTGEPGDGDILTTVDPTYDTGDDQFYHDCKICNAYQNMIERLCNLQNFCWPIDSETDEGAIFIDNYNHEALEPYNYNEDIDEWTSGSYYSDVMVWHLGRVWVSLYPTSAEPSLSDPYGLGTYWQQLTFLYGDKLSDPLSALITDRRWGCNESGFEFCLMVMGNFDWYFDSSHPYIPSYILLLRDDLLEAEDEEDVDAAYPLPAGTWRRTWRHTHGRLSATLRDGTTFTPQSDPETYYEAQSGPLTFTPYWWPGIFTAETPTETPNETEEALLVASHDQIELSAAMVNDLRRVLDCLIYNNSSGDIVQMDKTGNGTTGSPGALADVVSDAIDSADTALAAASWTENYSNTKTKYFGTVACTGTSGSPTWQSGMSAADAGYRMTGGWVDGRLLAKEIFIKTEIYKSTYFLNEPYTFGPEFTIGLPDGTQQTYQQVTNPGTEVPTARTLVFPPDIWDDDWDGSDEHIVSTNFYDGLPIPSSLEWVLDRIYYLASRIDFKLATTSSGEGQIVYALDLDAADEDVFAVRRDMIFTAVAADTENFDDDGNYIG